MRMQGILDVFINYVLQVQQVQGTMESTLVIVTGLQHVSCWYKLDYYRKINKKNFILMSFVFFSQRNSLPLHTVTFL